MSVLRTVLYWLGAVLSAHSVCMRVGGVRGVALLIRYIFKLRSPEFPKKERKERKKRKRRPKKQSKTNPPLSGTKTGASLMLLVENSLVQKGSSS